MPLRDFTGSLRLASSAGALVMFLLCSSCSKEPENRQLSGPPKTEGFEAKEARLDTTLWKDELLALRHERTFVQLRDQLLKATNKLELLRNFDFGQIVLPQAEGEPLSLVAGISSRQFSDRSPLTFSHNNWEEAVDKLRGSGWEIRLVEWNHCQFMPATPGKPATSSFDFELDAEHLPSGKRAILRGTLAVEWGPCPEPPSVARPDRLTVSALHCWERDSPPGFRRSFVVTPEAPAKRGVFIDLHPIILTDIDDDGNEDLILAGGNRLFQNRGGARFEPKEFIAGKVFHEVRSAAIVADFNGDARVDFLTVASDEGVWSNKLVLYVGTGSFPFTNEPVLACPGLSLHEPSVITAGDIDGDGDLDVFLAQYKPPYVGGQVPTPYYDANDGYPSALLINDGRGYFSPATESAGLAAKCLRRTYAASFVDLDDDGDLDLVKLNDFAGVDLYYNNGHGVFTDETARLYNRHLFGMSHFVADFDRDGTLDLLAVGMHLPVVGRLESLGLGRDDFPERTRKRVDMAYGNRLYIQRSGRWVSPDFAEQLARTGWTWGVTACDFDNNGALDLYLANGHFSGESSADYDSHYWRHDIYVGGSRENQRLLYYFAEPFMGLNTGKTSWNGYQHNVLFLDAGNNQYLNSAFLMDVAHESDCRAVVGADLDNDGRMDLVLTEAEWMGNPTTGRHRLLVCLNELSNQGHWIGVKLRTGPGCPSPIGARVTARSSNRAWVAPVITGNSFQSQHPNTIHFGLGKTDSLTELTVRWPNGETQRIENPAPDRYYQF